MALLSSIENLVRGNRAIAPASVMAVVLSCGPLFAAGWPGDSTSSQVGSGEMAGTLGKSYTFHEDWLRPKIPHWTRLLAEYKGRPDTHYLEIGTYEGRSFLWMVDNILTHPTARAVGVDIFLGDYERVLRKNIEISGAAGRIRIIDGYGERVMMTLPEESFDIIYLDGGHAPRALFPQAGLAWQLLKEGGVLIFDDYLWRPDWPSDQRPQAVVEMFLMTYGRDLEVLYMGTDVFVRKLAPACKQQYCSVLFENYVYDWQREQLLNTMSGQVVKLSVKERKQVEELLRQLADPDLRQLLFREVLDSVRARLDKGGDSTP